MTVTDKDGDTVKLQSKGGNKYTFTMPGSKVTVEATFTLEKEENLPFADVAEAVSYTHLRTVSNGETEGGGALPRLHPAKNNLIQK